MARETWWSRLDSGLRGQGVHVDIRGAWGLLGRIGIVGLAFMGGLWAIWDTWTEMPVLVQVIVGFSAFLLLLSIVGPGWSYLARRLLPKRKGVYHNKTVYLLDLVDDNNFITGRTFKDCEVHGPAFVVPLGETSISSGEWYGANFVELEEGEDVVYGAIGLRDCKLVDCDFYDVSFVASPDDIARIKKGFVEGGLTT